MNLSFMHLDSGGSFYSWENRRNAVYGNRYGAKQIEETQESAIKITAFPTPYSFPFGPKFEKLDFIINFISTIFEFYSNGK
jgi:hypothetical protein